ncbi:MAG TPA: CHAT domain-containing protein [Thermoanaerobaculia bacterium]|nr:CHAT domain-containing protein [Thermoanaerobaculia bacterium]
MSNIGHSLLAVLLLLTMAAAPPDADRAYQDARIRILGAQDLIRQGAFKKVYETAAPELPPSLRRSDIAVDRLWILAIAESKLDRFDEARRDLDEAQKLAAQAHPDRLPQVLLVRANMMMFPPAARKRAANEALRAARRTGDVKTQTKILGTLGNIAAMSERYDEAIDYGEKTQQLAIALHDDSVLQKTEGNLGWYLNELGDRDSAEEHLRAAIASATRMHADENRLVYLLNLGATEMSRGDLKAARTEFVQANDLAEKLSSSEKGNTERSIAEIELLEGHLPAARAENAKALHFNEKEEGTEPALAVQRSLILEARIDLAENKLDDATAILDRVLAEAKSKSVRWEAEYRLAEVCAADNKPEAADRHYRAAVETVDQARQDVRQTELRFSVPDLATPLYDDYIDFLVRQKRPNDALRFAELNRARTLTEGLQLDHEEKFDPRTAAREANVVALSYHLGQARSFLWVITPAEVKLFDLPPAATIESAVDRYQETFATARGGLEANGARGEDLYRMLVAPAAAALQGVRRLAIIADGRLLPFNFETLVVPATHRYWIEDVTIETAPSVQLLSRAHDGRKRGRLLLIGDAAPADRAFPPLQYAGEEMQRVKKHFDRTTMLSGARATPHAYFSSVPESYAFVHFVAHAVAVRQRPLDSAVVLASDGEGYKLYARDVVAHKIKAQLVTISSCHGAGRRTYHGEGLVGLAWAFLRAGSHEVIASLWEANDRATSNLMDSMYSAIEAGHDPVDALRIAKLQLLHSKTIYRKPFYWAPFAVYTGS